MSQAAQSSGKPILSFLSVELICAGECRHSCAFDDRAEVCDEGSSNLRFEDCASELHHLE